MASASATSASAIAVFADIPRFSVNRFGSATPEPVFDPGSGSLLATGVEDVLT